MAKLLGLLAQDLRSNPDKSPYPVPTFSFGSVPFQQLAGMSRVSSQRLPSFATYLYLDFQKGFFTACKDVQELSLPYPK